MSVSLLGFVLALQVVPIDRLGLCRSASACANTRAYGRAGAVAFMVPAVLLAFGAAGKTPKKAGNSLQFGVSMIGCCPIAASSGKPKAPWWDTWVPVNGQYAVLSKGVALRDHYRHRLAGNDRHPARSAPLRFRIQPAAGRRKMLAGK